MGLINDMVECVCPNCGEKSDYVVDYNEDTDFLDEIGDNFFRSWLMRCNKCGKNFYHAEKHELREIFNFM